MNNQTPIPRESFVNSCLVFNRLKSDNGEVEYHVSDVIDCLRTLSKTGFEQVGNDRASRNIEVIKFNAEHSLAEGDYVICVGSGEDLPDVAATLSEEEFVEILRKWPARPIVSISELNDGSREIETGSGAKPWA